MSHCNKRYRSEEISPYKGQSVTASKFSRNKTTQLRKGRFCMQNFSVIILLLLLFLAILSALPLETLEMTRSSLMWPWPVRVVSWWKPTRCSWLAPVPKQPSTPIGLSWRILSFIQVERSQTFTNRFQWLNLRKNYLKSTRNNCDILTSLSLEAMQILGSIAVSWKYAVANIKRLLIANPTENWEKSSRKGSQKKLKCSVEAGNMTWQIWNDPWPQIQ